MKAKESALLFFLGLTIWVLGTVYYGYRGAAVLETTDLRYRLSFIVSPVLSAAICIGILRWRRLCL